MSEVYCICRTSEDKSFMIACEECDEWFHGNCVGIDKRAAKKIEKYYCDNCRSKNGSISIKYKDSIKKVNLKPPKPPKPPKPSKPVKVLKPPKPPKQPKVSKSIQIAKPTKGPARSPHKGTKFSSKNGVQCGNPDCRKASRADSSYCSDECGLTFNKKRYEKFFEPRWEDLSKHPSAAKNARIKHWDKLIKTKDMLIKRINGLKEEKDELINTIRIIKEEAKNSSRRVKKENDDKDEEDESDDDSEEAATGDVAKFSCISCGHQIVMNNAFQHWAICHKKTEALYNFTADLVINYSNNYTNDPNPKLYCLHQDKKTKRFCMNLESACPLHSNWLSDKDEICGCPLNCSQKLEADGNYCLELKKDCKLHYHWDKFRLTLINMKRLQAFNRLEIVKDSLIHIEPNIDDSYGGVVGIMLHQTKSEEQGTKE